MAPPPAADKISFVEPRDPLRASTSSTSRSNNSDETNPEDIYEDWSKTTSEKDSWAYRERRRNSKFSKLDNDIAVQSYERQARSRRKGSSVLGVLADDKYADEIDVAAIQAQMPKPIDIPRHDERRLSMLSENSDKRQGSILSLWKGGKDKDGNHLILSGHEGKEVDTDVVIVDEIAVSESLPNSPRLETPQIREDRRGSILSIWRPGQDRVGNAVIDSGEHHDEVVVLDDDNGAPLEQVVSAVSSVSMEPERDDRQGSVLSIWRKGKDKHGNALMLQGEAHDDDFVPPPEVVKPESPPSGQERRGSILSMWTEGRERDEYERPGKVILHKLDEE